MTKLPMIFFVLLAPALLLFAAPIFLAHVAVHVLIDRMRRPDRRGATPTRNAIARPTTPTWKSPILNSVSTRS